ncbi:hypothetical protein GCM10010121_047210 [Streptomyces brasiliensis]|uniref:Methyltransferase type 11 domain-containing protein n=1 Tax=Streptomyces brasiliensis TaxID=1954 RepID=A0A917NUU9_9ACTN|nr:hypothetical protein GCM10010121_047210 [Streptomyces brasiliensis]
MHDCIPDDHARQVTSRYYLDQAMRLPGAPDRVVDLGCGRGTSAGLFRRHDPNVQWLGVDIRESPEAAQRLAGGDSVVYFDGVRLPFRSDALPLIYSHQVFEHVARPGNCWRRSGGCCARAGCSSAARPGSSPTTPSVCGTTRRTDSGSWSRRPGSPWRRSGPRSTE